VPSDASALVDRRGVWVIVVAAGSGSRFGGAKQYEDLGGMRVLDHSLRTARSVADGVVLVAAPDRAADQEPDADVVVPGGATRSDSVRAGLDAVPSDAEVVLVHDAARPLATAALFRRVVDAVRSGADAAIPAVPVVDTLWTVDGEAVDRTGFVAVQTPQGFRAEALRAAHHGGGTATDDATLVAATGGHVRFVDGESSNGKITTASDLVVAAARLHHRAVGAGEDPASAGLTP
jgi:2-C-methyl-D-erythritol 4-phosphate cytidylyltransferase